MGLRGGLEEDGGGVDDVWLMMLERLSRLRLLLRLSICS